MTECTKKSEEAKGTKETKEEKGESATFSLSLADEDQTKIIALYGPVEEEKCEELVVSLIALETLAKEGDEPIKFIISSDGGAAYEMFSVYDAMRSLKNKIEIETIGLGKIMSAAVLLLAAGTKGKRKIGKYCRVMIHEVKAGQSGSLYQMENEIEEVKNLQKVYIDCFVNETNLSRAQIKRLFSKRKNIYLSAEQAVEYGIADIII
jgi:ATP-dependent Clp protease protease subunit